MVVRRLGRLDAERRAGLKVGGPSARVSRDTVVLICKGRPSERASSTIRIV